MRITRTTFISISGRSAIAAREPFLCASLGRLRRATVFDRVPDLRLDIDAVETVDLLNAGWRGDVDLGQVIADHVDADEDQSAFLQCRADRLADVALARRKRGLDRL